MSLLPGLPSVTLTVSDYSGGGEAFSSVSAGHAGIQEDLRLALICRGDRSRYG